MIHEPAARADEPAVPLAHLPVHGDRAEDHPGRWRAVHATDVGPATSCRRRAQLAVVNHPSTGPMIAGPRQTPIMYVRPGRSVSGRPPIAIAA